MYQTLADIIYGINHCVTKASENLKKVVDEDYELPSRTFYTLKRPGTNRSFEIKDYAPNVFENLRIILGAPGEKFLESWEIPEGAQMEQSTARSGSLFYTTPDLKYLFKTVLHPEVGVMMGLLKDYYEHVIKHPKSFVVKIFGLFRVTQYDNTKFWVLIMGNAFPPQLKLDCVYDLKGRVPKPGKSVKERGVISTKARKDNEFVEDHKILFEADSKQFYLQQLQADVELLKNHNIMDYSLLVGIYKLKEEDKILWNARKKEIALKEAIQKAKEEVEKEEKKEKKEKKSGTNSTTKSSKKKSLAIDGNDNEDEDNENEKEKSSEKNSRNTENEKSSKTNTKQQVINLQLRNKKSNQKLQPRAPDGAQTERPNLKSSGEADSEKPSIPVIIQEDEGEKKPPKMAKKAPKIAISDSDDSGSGKRKVSEVTPTDSPSSTRKQQKSPASKKRPQSEILSASSLNESSSPKNTKKEKLTDEKHARRASSPLTFSPTQSSSEERPKIRSASSVGTAPSLSRDGKKKSSGKKRPKQKVAKEEEKKEENEFPYGALFAKDPITGEEELIFMSVIDTLTEYNFNKQLAHFFKKMLWDTHTLSTVRAEFYAKRFSDFMLKNLLADEEAVDVPSDEEEDFKQHVEGMARDGKLPTGPRRVQSSSNITTAMTTTNATTASTFTTKSNGEKNSKKPSPVSKTDDNINDVVRQDQKKRKKKSMQRQNNNNNTSKDDSKDDNKDDNNDNTSDDNDEDKKENTTNNKKGTKKSAKKKPDFNGENNDNNYNKSSDSEDNKDTKKETKTQKNSKKKSSQKSEKAGELTVNTQEKPQKKKN